MNSPLKKVSILCMLLCCLFANYNFGQSVSGYKVGQKVDNFSLYDFNSVRYATKNVKTKKLIALVFISNECNYLNQVIRSINTINSNHPNDAEIWAVNSFDKNLNPNEGEEKMKEFVEKNSIQIPYLNDLGMSIANQFSIKQVPSAVLLLREGDQFKVVYNGSVIDLVNGKQINILEKNISNVLNGNKVLMPKAKQSLCEIR